ncbi:homoisocitrate dehydrogenase [Methanobrevibacter cuticularis]|uniref:Homoisocitrate dehydrogenase n=1 Tax=Methanobrevibacter cuticularis TaxID=47311 RepID=A0A166EY76_9EURY|nr:homoisocitrate dehydrogenase [Methanobrevibacter cuticularis]KZX17134.1 homoisocitrate dehydrogenase [Methanobrevibacter cuticularis]
MIKVTTIPGDGIGKEVMEAGIAVLDALDLNFDFIKSEAGDGYFQENGNTIPEETLKNAKNSQATLFGAITSTPGERSPIITLRKELDAFANLRPIKSFEGINSLYNDLDFLVVRENTEGLYSQVESYGDKEETIAISERIITKKASERIARFAFDKAISDERNKVTCVHKANVLKKTDGLFKRTFYDVAKSYPKIKSEDLYIDAVAMYLIKEPRSFDIIVTTNLFGDILSDEAAGLVGGLGLAPSGNIGDNNGLFEPVHGSAPDIAGKNISNPIAMILSSAMMLDFLDENYYANQITTAVENVLKARKIATPDLGGTAKTMDLANAVIEEINKQT